MAYCQYLSLKKWANLPTFSMPPFYKENAFVVLLSAAPYHKKEKDHHL